MPLAVTVVSGDAIASQGRTSLEGAQYLVPSLNFVKAGTALNQALFLRGIGTTSFRSRSSRRCRPCSTASC